MAQSLSKKHVLEEDEYVDALDKIIERDFFPDLQRLKHQTMVRPMLLSKKVLHAKHTSEDNAAFEELQEKAVNDHKRKYHWAYEDTANRGDAKLHLLNDGTWISRERRQLMDKACDTKLALNAHMDISLYLALENNRPAAPDTWTFRVRNPLHFPPDLDTNRSICKVPPLNAPPLSSALLQLEHGGTAPTLGTAGDGNPSAASVVVANKTKRTGAAAKPPMETVYANSRFRTAFLSAQDEMKDVDPMKDELQNFVPMTPMLVPGAADAASPMITWGSIDATPATSSYAVDQHYMSMEADGVYKLAILGGGPAGIGILVRAARLGLLPQLLQPPDNATRGVALIHGGPVETLGVGNLGDYIINSNTYAKSLVTSVLEEKPELDPPESVQGTFLANLATHATATRLMDAGNTTIALAELGKFLGAVGQEARLEMLKYTASSTCYVNTTALRVERIVATAPSVDGSSVEPKTSHVCKITIQPAGGTAMCIFAESVVLAMGGKQSLPTTDLSASQLAKTWLSDAVLREPGRGMLASALAAAPQKKVCIVGGSHSAFSVAWTLLQKPTQKDKTISFAAKDITILHRAPVRCYYATKKEAEADGVVVDKLDKCGSVNTFTGLREDAKALFQAIEAGKETRVRLFHVRKHSAPVQTQALDAATAIVWCCGYGTNMVQHIPLVHGDGTPLEVSRSRGGAVEIDLHGRLVRAETHAPIDYLFGIGVGFSLRAAFDEMRTETRADGVTVYHRRGRQLHRH
ncbi:hypothetical protein DYB28_005348 [Aphanomyces astaci]|uniref:Uncharacterized protein n=1 Tax=Aphanomyces astaci TaxID=112090 RepID=A0A9X8E0C4_APHAT|nr:hypothetical protein DYB28_005348 [Aphanomyces astaci]